MSVANAKYDFMPALVKEVAAPRVGGATMAREKNDSEARFKRGLPASDEGQARGGRWGRSGMNRSCRGVGAKASAGKSGNATASVTAAGAETVKWQHR